LTGGARGPVRIALADATRHQRHGADRQAHRRRVNQREQRFGQPDGGDSVGAQVRNPEHVRTAKMDSIAISITIGTASMITARPTGAVV
jgi:hypothetical protein